MAEPATLEPVAPPASLLEHKERKAERAAGTGAPPAQQAPAVPKGETAGESANPPQEPQERKPRAKNAEERAAELRAAGRHKEADKILSDDAEQKEFATWKASKADRDREAEELRQLRARPASAAAPAPPAAAPQAAPSPASDKPKLKSFLEDPANAAKTHDDIVEEWEEAVSSWRDAKREAASATAARNTSVSEKEAAARQAHPDYDQYMRGQNFVDTVHRLHIDAVKFTALELANGTEVLYRLAKDPDECRRIAGLSQYSQVIELGVMSRAIAAESGSPHKPPEKPATPPVSRTPPPVRSLGGIAPGEPMDSKKPPESLAEHKQRKAAARAS